MNAYRTAFSLRPGIALLLLACQAFVPAAGRAEPSDSPVRPRAGKTEILRTSEIKPGMKGTVWTVFSGSEPEPVPVEIIGLMKNAWGPKQDLILGRLGGKAAYTGVAGGMSGSPVYVDGKMVGAVSLRIGEFTKEPICGITPIELMLEINDFDQSRPADAKTPDRVSPRASVEVPGSLLAQAVAAGGGQGAPVSGALMTPIETPLVFSGFTSATLEQFGPVFRQMGITPVQGGASGNVRGATPAPGWQNALNPGDAIAGVMVSGDMNITGLGTVTYNDGKRVLGFGHPFFNIGPVSMPMSKGEVLMILPTLYQPNKFANATEIVGALRQDRHSGIMGELGATAETIPVDLKVRSFSDGGQVVKEKKLHFDVFVQQKWTPMLMMVTLFNSINGLNDHAEEATYRFQGNVEMDGQPDISLTTMLAPNEAPIPATIQLAGWWGDKFNRLFLNNVKMPKLRGVNAVVDLLPERRVATIESAFLPVKDVSAGSEVPIKVYLRPYRGERLERDFTVKIPAGLPKGEHRILLSDADTLNRMQAAAGAANRFIDLPQTVSLINQERSNNKLYVSFIQSRPTVFYDDKTLPSLPASAMNVIQSGRTASRPVVASSETALEQMSLPFDLVVNGSYSLRVTVD